MPSKNDSFFKMLCQGISDVLRFGKIYYHCMHSTSAHPDVFFWRNISTALRE
jgi:hypothetical protein